MRLLHSIHSVNPAGGGVIEAVRQLAGAHQAEGHVVEIVSLDAPDAPWVSLAGFPVHAVGDGRAGYGYSDKLVPWLQRRAADYDAVIVNGLWQYSSFGIWRALRETQHPYFVFPHGMLDPWFKDRYPLKHLKKAVYWRLAEYRVLRDARAVFFTTEEEQRLAERSFTPFLCRTEIVPLGVAAPDGDPDAQLAAFYERFPMLRGKHLLLFLGRLHEKKGCEMLLETWRQAGENADVHLMFAGPPSDEGYMSGLRRLAGSSTSVSFPGMLSGDIKWGALRAADAFILPSHQENFGMAVVEALACGTPVLISDKVNIWREISSDSAGMVERDDLDGTRKLVSRWLSLSHDEQRKLRSSARACFDQRFEIGRAARRMIDLVSRSSRSLSPSLRVAT
jgi:glycosyltransferase involved in cell wall biosynthesis